ncbi:AraC family transcriptional regulator [Microlunatus parietis]|uniref:AraC-like DNA-binding protein n=1 Tax=Microlunatus parietis TaxID=682979 RepID=A0A7Y9IBN9_9ACTN|nr:AraC family transcriptional regulator [Microlunatus parietis]NYE73899.1 AraC-like DNA-binding protein [Microlunatus parietis]
MDTLSRLLRDLCPREARFVRAESAPLSVGDEGPLTLITPLDGEATLEAGPAEPATPIPPGTLALLYGRRATVTGAPLLIGTFTAEGSLCDRVLEGLPDLITVRSEAARHPVAMVVEELATERPGRQAVLDQLLGLLLITTLRSWLDRPDEGAPRWYHAQHDPVVGEALQLIHAEPARAWTVAGLAREVAVSRAGFAQRFTALVGEPPMTYLTCWRTCLAADLLEHSDDTLDTIARQVGYSDADALSVAFRRVRGIRPSEHRAAVRRGALPGTSVA